MWSGRRADIPVRSTVEMSYGFRHIPALDIRKPLRTGISARRRLVSGGLQRSQSIRDKFDFFRIEGVVGEIEFVIADGGVGVISLKGDLGEPIVDRISCGRELLERLIILLCEIELARLRDG